MELGLNENSFNVESSAKVAVAVKCVIGRSVVYDTLSVGLSTLACGTVV